MASLTRSSLRSWLRAMAEQDLAPATIRQRFSAVRVYCGWAVLEGLLEANPAAGLRPPVPPVVPVEPYTPDEIDRMLTGCGQGTFNSARNRAILSVLTSGLRIAEVAGITLENLNLPLGQVHVRDKGSKWRRVPLDRMTMKNVKKYLRRSVEHRYATISQFLFIGERSGANGLNPDAIDGIIKRVAKRAEGCSRAQANGGAPVHGTTIEQKL